MGYYVVEACGKIFFDTDDVMEALKALENYSGRGRAAIWAAPNCKAAWIEEYLATRQVERKI